VTTTIRAAGGVVVRKTPKGGLRVLVAHRPKYDDWSLPKGKIDDGETSEEAAVREILEETGQHCRIAASLGTSRYRIGQGIKEVDWFLMRPLPDSPGFQKNIEVDKVKWLSRRKAVDILDYERDVELVSTPELKKLTETGTVRFLRHANASSKDETKVPDRERSLTKKGRKQSLAIAESLASTGIERILSSPYKRCVQTVEPLAEMTGAPIEIHEALAEDSNPDDTYDVIHEVAGSNTVLCSHGDVIPAAINRLMWLGLTLHSRFYCTTGSIWEVDVVEGRYSDGRYRPPPKV